jgi:apolipoprotein N-acyltransferase
VRLFNPRHAAAFVAGALLSCAFAPLNWWPLAVLCPAVLMWLWHGASPRQAACLGFWFNAGTFAFGTYWLYISIHLIGHAPVWLAAFLMLALAAIMGLYQALVGYCVARWLPSRGKVRWLVAMPAAWLLIEWWRGWFLSGFSWLSLGYSQTETWLSGFAPVVGLYGISALLLVCAGAVITLVLGGKRDRGIAAVVLVLPWLVGFALTRVEWTRPSGPPVSVAILQGAIPEELKWEKSNLDATLRLYRNMTLQSRGHRLIVLPEAALPGSVADLEPYIADLYRSVVGSGSSLVFGVLRDTNGDAPYYNSVLALDGKVTIYDKSHLVPYAEFFPVPDFVRSWLRMMSLPSYDISAGPPNQPPLYAGGLKLGATVCYEDAYGSSMLAVQYQADALVNVTNDAWFGHSTAKPQHFQIAQMRALEAQRYLIRAANDGISGVIGPHGETVARAPEYTPQVLYSSIVPRTGVPPYARVGNWLVVIVATFALAYGLGVRQSRGRRPPPEPPTGTASASV